MEESSIANRIKAGTVKCKQNVSGKSSVWKTFFEIYDASSNCKLDFVQCNVCKAVLKYKSTTGSSRLSRHASACAPVSTKPLETFFHPPERKIPQDAKKKVQQGCVNLCTLDLRPFDLIEGSGFLSLAQTLIEVGAAHGNVKAEDILPHRTSVSKHVKLEADVVRKEVLPRITEVVEKAGGGLTTDLWTEQYRQTTFICITCHFVDEDFHLNHRVLTTVDFPNVSKTGENVKSELINSLDKIGFHSSLLSKCTFVTDEGPNVVCALKTFSRISCICHVLNTVLKHSFSETAEIYPEIKTVVNGCKSLVAYLKKSGLVKELKRSVHQEVETRWNTLCTMMSSVLTQLPEIKELLESKNQLGRLEGVDSDIMDQMVSFLDVFLTASTQLESDKEPTLHKVLLWHQVLKKHCDPKSTDSELLVCFKGKTALWMEKKIKIDILHKMATFLHPKYKSLKMLSQAQRTEVHQQIRQLMPVPSNTMARPSMSHPSKPDSIFSEWADEPTSEVPADELQEYLDAPVPPESLEDADLLSWWKKSNFPALGQVARRIFCIPASSASSERAFSSAGRVLEERRTRLSPEAVDAILFLRDHGRAAKAN